MMVSLPPYDINSIMENYTLLVEDVVLIQKLYIVNVRCMSTQKIVRLHLHML
jgi:hypothetical protein